jgi:16S rRNA (guanine966-N2)-methyltransferase
MLQMADEFSVQGGVFKNKKIPILESSKGHSNFTTSIMKKAIFSMIDSHVMSGNLHLEEALFIDLFSGSGQMALEALSRGFNKVHLFEIDTKRFSGLKKNLSQYSENMIFHHKDSFRYFDKIEENENFSLVYFLDPPYTFWEGARMLALIDSLKAMKNCKNIYVQSPKILKDWEKEGRRFGNCYISELS